MRPNPLDDPSVNRLLAGAVTAADAPPGYNRVAALLSAARPHPASSELPGEASTVAAMHAAISTQTPLTSPRRTPMLRKILTAKAAAVAGALLLTTTGAAAATGSLPGAAQQVASDALAKVGISVPGHDSHAGDHPDSRGASGDHANTGANDDHATNGQGDDHTGTTGPNEHAQFGQCNAQAASDGHPNEHSAVANATGCTDVTHPGNGNANGSHVGTEPETGDTNHGSSQSTDHGPPSSVPANSHAGDNGSGQGASDDSHGNQSSSGSSNSSSNGSSSSSGSDNAGDHGRP